MRVRIAQGLALAMLLIWSPAAVADPPTTAITAGPAGTSILTSPRFDFIANKAATFQCSVDGAPFSPCTSPTTIGPLALGSHTFSVRAIGDDGAIEDPPVSRQWLVVPTLTPPIVRLTSPSRRTIRIRSLRTLSGTARAPSEVTSVEVALYRGGPIRRFFPPRCRFVDLRTGRRVLQACVLPDYFDAKGTTDWRFTIPSRVRRRLKPGRYTLAVRAFNVYQQATQQFYKLTLR